MDIENHAALADYLRRRDPPCEMIHARTLAGGVSNRTVLVRLADGQSWVIKQALAKLRTKADWFSDPARVHREALGIRWLSKLATPGTIPEFVFEDFENHLLAMQAVPEPHQNWKEMLLAGRVDQEHFNQFGRLLGTVHRTAAARASELAAIFEDRQFFETLRIEPYYEYTAQQVPEARVFLADLIDQTRARRVTLVHGDYSPKNILVYQGQLILLDHEVIHWGDPAFDVGFAMAHFLSKARHLPSHRAHLFRAAGTFVNAYMHAASISDSEIAIIRHTLACLLARVAGRSPLEYLSYAEKRAQQCRVVGLMNEIPQTMANLCGTMLIP